MTSPETIGRYTLQRRIAVGGMAELFLALEDATVGLERRVVIKRMLPHLSEDQAFRDMFTREARTMARLHHPGVVQIFELGEVDNLPYIAMEFVPGRTLRDVLVAAKKADSPLPIDVAVDLACQACAAAHAVHELSDEDGVPLNLVHRDLTPHNVMVTPDGFVKLLDFGIVTGAHESRVTQTGVLKGKMAYLSPEQIEQMDVDRRADVFALAAVTWELLAGDKLFDAPNEIATLRRILRGDTRTLRDVRPEVPEVLSTVLHLAVSPDREQRPPSAEALRLALVRAAAGAGHPVDRDRTVTCLRALTPPDLAAAPPEPSVRPVPTFSTRPPEPPPPQRTRQLPVLAGALFAAIAGLGWWFWPHGYQAPTGVPVHVTVAPVRDAATMLADLEPVRRHLEQTLQRPVSVSVGADYADTLQSVRTGSSDVGIVPPGVFVRSLTDPPGLQAIAAKIVDGSRGTEGVVLGLEGVDVDLHKADLTMCYADPDSTTGYHLARAWLRSQQVDPDGVTAVFSGNHLQVLRDLLDHKCDLAATYTGNWTSADTAGVAVAQTRLVSTTGWTPHDVVVVDVDADPALVSSLHDALIHFDGMTAGTRGLSERLSGFSDLDASAVAELRRRMMASGQP